MSDEADSNKPLDPRVDKLSSIAIQAEGAMGKLVPYTTSLKERISEIAQSLLTAEGVPAREIVPPSPEQLRSIIWMSVGRMIQQRELSGREIEGWEPEIISLQMALQDPRKIGSISQTNPFQIGFVHKTFQKQENPEDFTTTVSIHYSPDGVDDNRIFTDVYGVSQPDSSPFIIDAERYQGRRSFPEVEEVVNQIKAGQVDDALSSLPTIREGRRKYCFTSIDDILYNPLSEEEVANALRFLIYGVKQQLFSVEELVKAFSWSSHSSGSRTEEDLRYTVFKKMPEYTETVNLLKTEFIPIDENGTNISYPEVIKTIRWVIGETDLTDEEFRKVATLLPGWQKELLEQFDSLKRGESKMLHREDLHMMAFTLIGELPEIARNDSQRQIALRVLESMEKGDGIQLSEFVKTAIVELRAKKMLDY